MEASPRGRKKGGNLFLSTGVIRRGTEKKDSLAHLLHPETPRIERKFERKPRCNQTRSLSCALSHLTADKSVVKPATSLLKN